MKANYIIQYNNFLNYKGTRVIHPMNKLENAEKEKIPMILAKDLCIFISSNVSLQCHLYSYVCLFKIPFAYYDINTDK